MGTAEETTQFPPAYLQLDEKVDKIKTVFDGLMRATKQMLSSDEYCRLLLSLVIYFQHRLLGIPLWTQ